MVNMNGEEFVKRLLGLIEGDEASPLYRKVDYDDPEAVAKAFDAIREELRILRTHFITNYGNLYLTSGGRIVLDRGYGEYFNESDKVLFSLEELKDGIKLETFLKRISVDETKEE